MSKKEKDYKVALKDFTDALNVLDEAIALIAQLKDNPSFLEERSQDFKQAGENMHAVLKDFHHTRVFYQPLAEALIEMAQSNLADQDMVRKVLKFMNELRDSLNGGRIALTNGYESERKADQSILDLLTTKVQ